MLKYVGFLIKLGSTFKLQNSAKYFSLIDALNLPKPKKIDMV